MPHSRRPNATPRIESKMYNTVRLEDGVDPEDSSSDGESGDNVEFVMFGFSRNYL